ncbi:MAG: DUF2256 domain-containing protein [Ferruginibacter sp.]
MKTREKEHLPSKVCLACQRPFSWRKSWEKVWEDVRYCSDKCRKNKRLKSSNKMEARIVLSY